MPKRLQVIVTSVPVDRDGVARCKLSYMVPTGEAIVPANVVDSILTALQDTDTEVLDQRETALDPSLII